MKYYFACYPAVMRPAFPDAGVRKILTSFGVSKTVPKALREEHDYEVIIDSGAFTAWNMGKKIDIDEYIQFGQGLDSRFHFVSLDVIPETGSSKAEIQKCIDQSKENYLYLKDKLASVVPVYHSGEDLSVLRWYLDHTDYIGVSPANDLAEKGKRAFLNTVFNYTGGATFKAHGFGYSSETGMFIYPFYSVDSTSWMRIRIHNLPGQLRGTSIKLFHYLRERIEYMLHLEKEVTEYWERLGVKW